MPPNRKQMVDSNLPEILVYRYAVICQEGLGFKSCIISRIFVCKWNTVIEIKPLWCGAMNEWMNDGRHDRPLPQDCVRVRVRVWECMNVTSWRICSAGGMRPKSLIIKRNHARDWSEGAASACKKKQHTLAAVCVARPKRLPRVCLLCTRVVH